MVSPAKRGISRSDHEHAFDSHNLGADLQRQICGQCGHVSINPTESSTPIPSMITEKARLFGVNPEFIYRLARVLDPIPVSDPSRRRFGERRTERRR